MAWNRRIQVSAIAPLLSRNPRYPSFQPDLGLRQRLCWFKGDLGISKVWGSQTDAAYTITNYDN